jgi:hypothetical protein
MPSLSNHITGLSLSFGRLKRRPLLMLPETGRDVSNALASLVPTFIDRKTDALLESQTILSRVDLLAMITWRRGIRNR